MYLLDTHTILWALAYDPRLGEGARSLWLDDTTPLVLSAASVWEMAIKVAIGKLTLARPLAELVARTLPDLGIAVLPINERHTLAVERLPWHHRDPFDRLLVATCLVDSPTHVTRDPVFDAYGIRTRW